MQERPKEVKRIDRRLYPSRFSDRFYHLSSLRQQIELLIEAYLSKKPNLRLVDFGCGSANYRPLFAPHVTEYIGVDLPGNPQADLHILPNGTAPLPDHFADVVLSTQVLEHVDDPSKYLLECHRILKLDGLLILSTHGYWVYHPHPNDYWRWTGSGLRKILDDAGFSVLDFRGVMGLASAAMQLFQDAVEPKIPSLAIPVFALLMQTFIALLDKLQSAAGKTEDACLFVVVSCKKNRAE